MGARLGTGISFRSKDGGSGGTRTLDQLVKSQLLYQLSYRSAGMLSKERCKAKGFT